MNHAEFQISQTNNGHRLTLYKGNEKTVYIPEEVSAIASGAFPNSPNTEEIVVPASVKTVNSCAFYGCQSLKRIRFLGTEVINLRAKVFDSLPSPLEIVYGGTVEGWIESSQKYEEEQSQYDNGWGGGAPGVYTYIYSYYPMEHSLGEKFQYIVKTLADGKELRLTGKREPFGGRLVSSPYDPS